MNNKTQENGYDLRTRTASVFLSAALLATTVTGLGAVLSAAPVNAAENSSYGLMDTCQEGVILHCFNWKYTDIIEELPNIAKAGFTSVQTSPAQTGVGDGDAWYWLYQPVSFAVTENRIGTKEELRQLCEEADKYGIKVIVDVVANHLAEDHQQYDFGSTSDLTYWHDHQYSYANKNVDGTSRYQITHCDIGMPDLNTENEYVQSVVKNYLLELKNLGVDGIRFDAIKHIGLPSEGDSFLDNTLVDGLYYYGEILGAPDSRGSSATNKLMKEYTDYMSITDDVYGKRLRDAFNNGTVESSYGYWCTSQKGSIDNDKLVYWGESHDTWSNDKDYGYSNEMTQNVIDRAYAIAASRNQITALYFSRPSETDKQKIKAGVKGSTHFTSPEVAAVNHFHNAMNGQPDYYTTGNSCSAVCRTKGAVIVAGSGGNKTVTVPNGGSTTEPGTYIDEITGSTWTVTSSTITGTIGDTGIAVIYDPDELTRGSIAATPATGTTFTDTLTLTLKAVNMETAVYKTSEGVSGTYTNGTKITIGSSTAAGKTVTVTLTGKTADSETITETYIYKKKDPNEKVKVYFDNSEYQWSSVYAYVYDDSGTTKELSAWPGTQMSVGSSGFYELEIPDEYTENGLIIFSEKGSSTNRYPARMNPGIAIGGSSKKFSYGAVWEDYIEVSEELSNTSEISAASVVIGDSLTVTGAATGGSGDYTYAVYYKQTSQTTWTKVQDYASEITKTITPKAATTYTVRVKVKDSAGTIKNKDFKVTVSKTLANTSTISAASIVIGDSLTVTGAATGGSGDYTYAVYYKQTSQTAWTKVQDYASEITKTITPKAATTYTVRVKAKDSAGTVKNKDFTITVSKKLANTSEISAAAVSVGGSVTLTGSGTGGLGGYTYAVYYKPVNQTKWTAVQSYASEITKPITFKTADTYTVRVKLKDSAGTIKNKDFTVTVTN